jgi:hypothetical protein
MAPVHLSEVPSSTLGRNGLYFHSIPHQLISVFHTCSTLNRLGVPLTKSQISLCPAAKTYPTPIFSLARSLAF